MTKPDYPFNKARRVRKRSATPPSGFLFKLLHPLPVCDTWLPGLLRLFAAVAELNSRIAFFCIGAALVLCIVSEVLASLYAVVRHTQGQVLMPDAQEGEG